MWMEPREYGVKGFAMNVPEGGQRVTVTSFLAALPDSVRRDAIELSEIFADVTGREPVMWGPSIVGYGNTDYVRNEEHACDGLEVGFAPRDGRIFLYLRRYADHYADFVERIGQVYSGRAAISFDSLSSVDRTVLKELIAFAWGDRA